MDGHKTSAQWRGTGWYRFTGAAGTMMATKKEVTKHHICGSHATGHLDTNTHPNLAEGQSQEQKVCFYYSTQCQWSTTVKIQKCDGFYIYKLPSAPTCSLRYCGASKMGNGISDDSVKCEEHSDCQLSQSCLTGYCGETCPDSGCTEKGGICVDIRRANLTDNRNIARDFPST